MIDKVTDTLKLVEYNTVASSFGVLCSKVKELQSYLIEKYSDRLKKNYNPETLILDDQLGSDFTSQMAQVFKKAC